MPTPKVLIIAGSDSSGGAGLEADQKTLAAHGVYAMTATTALTAQNTLGVEDVLVTPPAFVEKQIRCVLDDMGVEVIKMGMLASSDTVTAIGKTLKDCRERSGSEFKIVLDPVMVSTSGAQLLPGDAVRHVRTILLPTTFILTPNIPEATLLLRDADIQYRSPSSIEDLKSLAKKVHSLGPEYVLLKGGHMPLNKHTKQKAASSDPDSDKIIADILFFQSSNKIDFCWAIEQPYLSSSNTHGTGCSLASAIAAGLTTFLASNATEFSSDVYHICRSAITYVSTGISTSSTLSLSARGSGPINHFHSIQPTLFPAGGFITYLLSHPTILRIWHRYTHHPFTSQLATGTLPLPAFKSYMIQDYLYLTHFARTYALAGYKSTSINSTVSAAVIIQHIRTEMDLHLAFRKDFGLTQSQIEAVPESQACTAYSRYVLDIGMSSDLLALYVALAPCLLGYGQVASRIHAEHAAHVAAGTASPYKDTSQGNKYWKWIENYVAEDYREAVRKGREVIEELVEEMGFRGARGKVDELVTVFKRATEMEVKFWDVDAHVGEEAEDEEEDMDFGLWD